MTSAADDHHFVVTLNVGGRRFQTTNNTVTNSGSEHLAVLLAQQDVRNNEELFVDCDPNVFEHVLYFMRRGKLSPPFLVKEDIAQMEELKYEADFLKYPALQQECTSRIQLWKQKPKARLHKAVLAGDWESGNYNDLEIEFLPGEEDHVVYLVSANITGEWETKKEDNSGKGIPVKPAAGGSRGYCSSEDGSTEFKDSWRKSFVAPGSLSAPNSPYRKGSLPNLSSSKVKDAPKFVTLSPNGGNSGNKSSDKKSGNKTFTSKASKVVTGAVSGTSKVVTGAVTGTTKLVTGAMSTTSNAIRKSVITLNMNDPKNQIRRRESTMRSSGRAECYLHCNYLQESQGEYYYWNDKDLTITHFQLFQENDVSNIDVTKKIGVFLSRQPRYKILTLSVSGPGEWELLYWKGPAEKIPTV